MTRLIAVTTGLITSCLILAPASLSLAAPHGSGPKINPSDVLPLSVSADLKFALITDAFSNGLKLIDTDSGQATIVSGCPNSGVYASISSDGKYVCYKAFDNGSQIPMLFDIVKGENIALSAPAQLAGTPAAAGGLVAYTLGNDLIILNSSLKETARHDLGVHVNLLAISPDGGSIAYNNADLQIVVLNLKSGKSRVVTNKQGDFWGPQFSPKGDKILASTADGNLVAGNAHSGIASFVARGESAGWADNDTIAYSRKSGVVGRSVDSTVIETVQSNGSKKGTVLSEPGDVNSAVVGGNILITRSGSKSLTYGYVNSPGYASLNIPNTAADKSAVKSAGDVHDAQNVVDGSTYKYLSNVPYLHQNNDTPDYWNGNSSCNAAAALMSLSYHYILPKHPITASWPSPHTSDYGWYVPEVYTFNGRTYNVPSKDPNGRTGWGGFGYITQNNWEETRGHMAEYIGYHGPTSGAVDWSPTFAKAKAEVDANHPSVLLNSLTSAGHYIVTMGYYKSQYTLIFNDSYGNKNTNVYPSNDGRSVRYDWPGYNNGYKNLNTVHAYIYCRMGQPSAPSGLTATPISSSQINLAWTDNSFCEEFYDIFRSTSSGTGFTKIASVGTNVKTYSSTGLAAATRYYYRVQARNPSGSSADSNEANALTQGSAPPADIIVDNSSAGFTASTNWSTGTSAADKYGTNYRFRSTQAISDSAVWNFSPTQARNYEIYAWWSAGTNRSATAPYIMPDGASVSKNQQTGGGVWNSLGIKNLTTGAKTVKLSCWTTTGYVVLADAIKVVAR